MSHPFAVVQDVANRWRALSSEEITIASVLIEDASDMIRVRFGDVDARVLSGSLSASSMVRVVANMVKRAMIAGDSVGMESRAQSAGPFSVTEKFVNPSANLYFTADDIAFLDGQGYRPRARTAWLA